MAFNFGISEESAVRSTKRLLAPWNIYDVEFKGVEIKEFSGKKDPTATYKTINFSFENEDGYISINKFFPKEGDDVRREVPRKDGTMGEMPSNFEDLMNFIKQTVAILTPKGYEKLHAASSKFRSFDDVAAAVKKLLDPVVGTKTKIKLIGRNSQGKVVADAPRITGINHDGVSFISDNWIGDKLYFNDYELGRIKEYQSATPTAISTNEPAPKQESDDIDSLLADL